MIVLLLALLQVTSSHLRIVVHKHDRTLQLYSDTLLVHTYRIALGTDPIDPKHKAGDRCTPEGKYYICEKNEHSHFYRSLGLSYPNADDAERGLRDRLISQNQYREIVTANKHHRKPPWNTPLGGEVMIHGGGTGRDWTWGCIALDNSNIKELFRLVRTGTEVDIVP